MRTDGEQRRDGLLEPGLAGGKFTHARLKSPVAHLADDLAERLQHAAYLGPEIASHVDELRAARQQRAQAMAVEALDRDLLIPARADDLRQAVRVVGIGFVQLDGQRRLGMPRIQADDGQAKCTQRVPVPSAERTRLKANPSNLGRTCAYGGGECFRRRAHLAAPDNRTRLIEHTYRSHLERDVQTYIVLPHGTPPQEGPTVRSTVGPAITPCNGPELE